MLVVFQTLPCPTPPEAVAEEKPVAFVGRGYHTEGGDTPDGVTLEERFSRRGFNNAFMLALKMYAGIP